MATPYKDMAADVWSFLNSKSTYTALGLTEHKGYDGDLLAFDAIEGQFPDGALPAIAADPSESIETQGFGATGAAGSIENGIEDRMTMELSVIYGTDGGNISRDTLEATQTVITDLLMGAVAVRTRLGSSNIADYDVRSQGIQAIRDSGGGHPRYWVWNFDIELTGNRRFVN